ncbi:MAG TPA: hypothetical protein ENH82_04510 [bacterium]|nr:hypothetical protein [bacterium]
MFHIDPTQAYHFNKNTDSVQESSVAVVGSGRRGFVLGINMFTNADFLKISYVLEKTGCSWVWNNDDHIAGEFLSNLGTERFKAEIGTKIYNELSEIIPGIVINYFDFFDGPGEKIVRLEIRKKKGDTVGKCYE